MAGSDSENSFRDLSTWKTIASPTSIKFCVVHLHTASHFGRGTPRGSLATSMLGELAQSLSLPGLAPQPEPYPVPRFNWASLPVRATIIFVYAAQRCLYLKFPSTLIEPIKRHNILGVVNAVMSVCFYF